MFLWWVKEEHKALPHSPLIPICTRSGAYGDAMLCTFDITRLTGSMLLTAPGDRMTSCGLSICATHTCVCRQKSHYVSNLVTIKIK